MASSLLEYFLIELQRIENASKTDHIRNKVPLKVLLLEKKEVFYITDGFIIVQATMLLNGPSETRDDLPKPLNRIRTAYYNFTTRHAHLFLFNSNDCDSEPSEILYFYHPYQPQFYFQDRLKSINLEKQVSEFSCLTETLVIKQWGLRLVNIGNTGYYGIVLEIYAYERKKEKFPINPNIHSILYEKDIAKIMEKFRLEDMREQISKPSLATHVSLCYFRKNVKVAQLFKSFNSNFVAVDRTSKILKVNLEMKNHCLPLGNVSGVLRFLRPYTNYTQSRKSNINFNMFRSLPEDDVVQDNSDHDLWSEEFDQSENEITEEEKSHVSNSQEESNEQNDDTLRLLYKKQLEKSMII